MACAAHEGERACSRAPSTFCPAPSAPRCPGGSSKPEQARHGASAPKEFCPTSRNPKEQAALCNDASWLLTLSSPPSWASSQSGWKGKRKCAERQQRLSRHKRRRGAGRTPQVQGRSYGPFVWDPNLESLQTHSNTI